jgi:3-hydroxyisobutyrate dehydrogenase
MASSALRAGIPTIVWNREPEATRNVAELGAEVAETAADAARRAEIVVTMVTDADAVISIARDQGMLAALAPGTIWVQMSTIGVAGIQRVAALVDADRPDVTLLDAPVSGSKVPAEQGQLTIFASGPRGPLARRSSLRRSASARIWVGAVGAIAAEARTTWPRVHVGGAILTALARDWDSGPRRRSMPSTAVRSVSPSRAKLQRIAKDDY